MKNYHRLAALGLAGVILLGGQMPAPSASSLGVTAKTAALRLNAGHDLSGEPFSYVQPTSRVSLQMQVAFSEPLAKVAMKGTITACTDDLGNDFSRDATIEVMRRAGQTDEVDVLSKDHRSVLMNVNFKNQVPAGARLLTVKGRLAIWPDVGMETFKLENVPLQLDTPISAGNVVLRMSNILVNRGYTSVTFRSANADVVKNIEFLDASSKPVGLTYRVERGLIYLPDKTTEQTISFPIDAGLSETVNLRVTVYRDAKMIEVPFELTTGIGM